MRPLKAVFFDAAGTLIYLSRSVGEHYRDVALRYGVEVSAEKLDAAFRTGWKTMPDRAAGPRSDDDKGWWRELVRRVLTRVLPPTEYATFDHLAYFETLYAHFALPGVWSAYDDAAPLLRVLHERGLRLGIISNFDRRLSAVLRHLELDHFFDCIIISSEVGAEKPDPVIFRQALAALDVTPEESVHVGDDPKRDSGARAIGIDVFELERPARSLDALLPWLDARSARENGLASRLNLP